MCILDATEYNESIVFLHSSSGWPSQQELWYSGGQTGRHTRRVISLARQELSSTGSRQSCSDHSGQHYQSQPSQSELFLPPVNLQLQERLESLTR